MKFSSIFDILKYISAHNGKEIIMRYETLLIYSISIKFYFPEIKITFILANELDNKNWIFLNWVDLVKASSHYNLAKLEAKSIVFVKSKPQIEIIV